MEWRGGFALATRAARALGQIGFDLVDERFGRALPRTPEDLAHPDVVSNILSASRRPGGGEWPRIDAVRLPGVDFESSNCRNFLIEIDWEGNASKDAALPRTMYVKLPCEETTTRVFGNAIGFWPLEYTFCERLAPYIPIRIPAVHGVAQRGGRFVLLLENLLEIEGIELFINRDMARGTSLERARRCLKAFATLHARFWGYEEADREALLPRSFHTYLARDKNAMTRAMNSMSIRPAHRLAPDLFSADHVATCELGIEKWDGMLEAWYGHTLTLVHGDSHLGNCFEYPGPEGLEVGMLDFQAVHWSQGIRDVQYFLINSLEPDLLAENEDDLIATYCGELARHGITLPIAEAREGYRAFSFQTLMTAVVPLGLDSLTERNETVLAILRRSTAAAQRLDLRGWIEAL